MCGDRSGTGYTLGMSTELAEDPTPLTAKTGRRLALDVHAAVRAMILSGELAPGSPIPQAALARSLNVSRTPMREAFRLLQEEGLIENRPDQRAVVRRIDPSEIDAVYTARVMLEAAAVSISVRVATPDLVRRLEAGLAQMRLHAADDDIDQWRQAHREFHNLTTEDAPMLHDPICSLSERADRFLRLAQLGHPNAWARWDNDHEPVGRGVPQPRPRPGGPDDRPAPGPRGLHSDGRHRPPGRRHRHPRRLNLLTPPQPALRK